MNIDKVGIGVVVRKNKGKCIHMYSYTSRFSLVKKRWTVVNWVWRKDPIIKLTNQNRFLIEKLKSEKYYATLLHEWEFDWSKLESSILYKYWEKNPKGKIYLADFGIYILETK